MQIDISGIWPARTDHPYTVNGAGMPISPAGSTPRRVKVDESVPTEAVYGMNGALLAGLRGRTSLVHTKHFIRFMAQDLNPVFVGMKSHRDENPMEKHFEAVLPKLMDSYREAGWDVTRVSVDGRWYLMFTAKG